MNPSRQVFEDHAKDYDRWSDEHDDTYQAQLKNAAKSASGSRTWS